MAAGIESMMYAGQVPWHGIGTAVHTEVTAGAALSAAGLDWKVDLSPVFAGDGMVHSRVDRVRATVRRSDQKPLGIVGERYAPVQNSDAFSFFDDIVGAGQAIYHTAGSLDGGRKIWILAKLPEAIVVAGADDVVEKYLLLVNSHDGSTTLRMLVTPIRVVCQNTLTLALRRSAGEGLAIRHTTSATARIDEARRALGIAHARYDEISAEIQQLAHTPYSDQQMVALATTLFPTDPEQPSTRMGVIRERVVSLFTEGLGHAPIRGTAWAALNAVAEFADHVRRVRTTDPTLVAEKRLASAWLGSGAALKRLAHETIRQQITA